MSGSTSEARTVPPSASSVQVGHELPGATIRVSRERLVEYAAASGDRNPIHWNESFATSVGLPGVIAHGMFTMGVAIEVVSAWAGAAAVREYGCKFVAPVPVGDEGAVIEVAGRVTKVDVDERRAVVDLTVTHAGVKVLGRARATVELG
ncbi:MaoC/PaaZ C-terminal domain-containing protein [Gephyromycinifex aptenodytis]|uniref:MaoC/PaaZ C-terminal domain-containing protein n=1 Tax=Gephyromycinifex aptenodytis TaxID=2716227 RepID=UPI0014456474|nr:MaoC/PaaZ C-terminal domain-containing protein [Gephyromycinifex aptenodytis]